MNRKSPWITVEGVDGAGKSSHIEPLIEMLSAAGFTVVSTREPGGTELCERLRNEILNTPMALQTEILLAFSSRSEHLDKVIRPALANGNAVVCDRFTDSTYAYQGAGRGGDLQQIKLLEQMVHGDIQPDLTLIFDLPPEESKRRLGNTGKNPDKFESQSVDFFADVRQGYLDRAASDPTRVKIIDSRPSLANVKKAVAEQVADFLSDWAVKQDAQMTDLNAKKNALKI